MNVFGYYDVVRYLIFSFECDFIFKVWVISNGMLEVLKVVVGRKFIIGSL